ncbi:hypothetical protein [Sphingobacterium sp. N143]|uniref:hypothetical protein n=1 Tax=Sphingobacterium sp. N143 TaxID=2746727 RepID=UPI002574FF86|nr:hypothetical protein [Sphingobacterium sp. N143]
MKTAHGWEKISRWQLLNMPQATYKKFKDKFQPFYLGASEESPRLTFNIAQKTFRFLPGQFEETEKQSAGMTYPEQFLPAEERKKKNEQEFEKIKEIPIYLETGNYSELPKQILKYVDIVKPLSEWYEIGIKPKKEKYGKWKAIKREERYFGFHDADLRMQSHKVSLETGKRVTEKPYCIKALNEQGIPLTDFVAYGEDVWL